MKHHSGLCEPLWYFLTFHRSSKMFEPLALLFSVCVMPWREFYFLKTPPVKFCPCRWSEATHAFRLTGWETRWSFPHPAHVSPCAARRGWKWWGPAALEETLWWSRSTPWADMTAPTRTLSATRWRKRMWEQAFPVQEWQYSTLEFQRLSSTLFLILHVVWNLFSNYSVEIENWNQLQKLHQFSSLSVISLCKLNRTSALCSELLAFSVSSMLTGPHGVGISSRCLGLRFGDRNSGSSGGGWPEIWFPNKGLPHREKEKENKQMKERKKRAPLLCSYLRLIY